MTDRLSYEVPGATRVDERTWTSGPPGYRRYEGTTLSWGTAHGSGRTRLPWS